MRVATGFGEEGGLVFDEQRRLVAVLVQLPDENQIASGNRFLEAGFGPLGSVSPPAFAGLDAAQDWISRRLSLSADAPWRLTTRVG